MCNHTMTAKLTNFTMDLLYLQLGDLIFKPHVLPFAHEFRQNLQGKGILKIRY